MRKAMKNSFSMASLMILGLAPVVTRAAEFELFPGEKGGLQDFRVYIATFYQFSIPAAALVATVLIMIGGVIWITSAGDQNRISKAREYIINSIIGIILLMAAYVILGFINPEFVNLKKAVLPPIDVPGACVSGGSCKDFTSDRKDPPIKSSCSNTGQTFFPGLQCADEEVQKKIQETKNEKKACAQVSEFVNTSDKSSADVACEGICEGCSGYITTPKNNGFTCSCSGDGQAQNQSAAITEHQSKVRACLSQKSIEMIGDVFETDDEDCEDYCEEVNNLCTYQRTTSHPSKSGYLLCWCTLKPGVNPSSP